MGTDWFDYFHNSISNVCHLILMPSLPLSLGTTGFTCSYSKKYQFLALTEDSKMCGLNPQLRSLLIKYTDHIKHNKNFSFH